MNKKGFTLLFTVLITSIVLAIALGISRVSYSELVLSSVSREGARAFFAADTGLECGLYHDVNNNNFALSPSQPISCAGVNIGVVAETPVSGISQASERFEFFFDLPDNACAYVNVYKDWVPEGSPDSHTRVEALGYNRSCAVVNDTLVGGNNQDPNLVERALRATYKNDLQLGGGGGLPTLQPQGQNSLN